MIKINYVCHSVALQVFEAANRPKERFCGPWVTCPACANLLNFIYYRKDSSSSNTALAWCEYAELDANGY